MRHTMLIRLAAPLQSWGGECKFDHRRTEPRPTKSGVVGMLAAALGRRRDEPLEDLAALEFGVRVDQPGKITRDYHMAIDPKDKEKTYVTNRYYLEDAIFLAGFSTEDEEFLKEIAAALLCPAFPLFLGRRSCPPTLPLLLGIVPLPLEEALRRVPWLATTTDGLVRAQALLKGLADASQDALLLRPPAERRQGRLSPELEIYTDGQDERGCALQRDLPVSFDPRCRRYAHRLVERRRSVSTGDVRSTEHDAFGELG